MVRQGTHFAEMRKVLTPEAAVRSRRRQGNDNTRRHWLRTAKDVWFVDYLTTTALGDLDSGGTDRDRRGRQAVAAPLLATAVDWLQPQVDSGFAGAANEAREYLTRADRQGDKFHLEPGESYELEGLELRAMATATLANATLAEEILLDVKRVLATSGSTITDFEHPRLRSISNWEEQFGCSLSDVLYVNLGG